MEVDWPRLGRDKFDYVVEALVRRQWDGLANVTIPDGRGGDEGIDIEVRRGDHLSIYQLKFFEDGFSGDRKTTRRRQIRNSYIRATALQPDKWLLVVPTKLTPGERQFVEDLQEQGGPEVVVFDRVELNNLMINFPDVYNYLGRDQMEANAVLFGRETDSLFNGIADLSERTLALGRLADSSVDPYWGIDFTRTDGVFSYELAPKTADSHTKSPIRFTVTTRFGPEQAELAKALRATIDFGSSDPVLLPADVVHSLKIDGPDFIAGTETNVSVQLNPHSSSPHIGASVQFQFDDEEGNNRGRYEGTVTHIGNGGIGGALEVDFFNGHHTVRILHAFTDTTEPIEVTSKFHLRKISPSDAVGVIDIAYLLRAPAGTLKVFFEDDFLMSMTHDSPTTRIDPDLEIIRSIADDLAVVQRHCKQVFNLPDTVTAKERIDLRVARLLVDGHAVESPDLSRITLTLNGDDTPELRDALTGARQSLRLEGTSYEFSIGRKKLDVGQVFISDPETYVIDPSPALEALDKNEAEDTKIELAPGTTRYFRCILATKEEPALFRDPPTPWNLPGIDQPLTPIDRSKP
ncbi:hypothetical protein DK926_19275 [Rhodococcus sp. Eu-32]|uniref:hypothetical protein n=1 Tax=Rhodococcus sp. Eu-32 TaxID=1017319 RepID=UPI000DF45B44|nr:hypothetical protein [Rhodococcus sp. Eu-32]RRQ26143.1 hypothetical protein DK926_19275 [Rhodococcus sp. Eu-32]